MSGEGARLRVSGADLIAAERKRQIEIEGYTPDHDREHGGFALSQAAFCYKAYGLLPPRAVPDQWPWDIASWKPRDPVRNLIRAGALYLAAAEQGYQGSRDAAERCALLLDEAAASLLGGGEEVPDGKG